MLKSKNPFHWPKVDPNFFNRPEDVAVLIQGIQAVSIDLLNLLPLL